METRAGLELGISVSGRHDGDPAMFCDWARKTAMETCKGLATIDVKA